MGGGEVSNFSLLFFGEEGLMRQFMMDAKMKIM